MWDYEAAVWEESLRDKINWKTTPFQASSDEEALEEVCQRIRGVIPFWHDAGLTLFRIDGGEGVKVAQRNNF